MRDNRVDAALDRLRPLPDRERRRVASGPFEAQAVLLLAGLDLEAKMVASVAHMQTNRAFLTLQGVAEERGLEALMVLTRTTCNCGAQTGWKRHHVGEKGCHVEPCGDRCLLVNQGPCGCRVPPRVAELRRRQRALLWACEAIMRPVQDEAAKSF